MNPPSPKASADVLEEVRAVIAGYVGDTEYEQHRWDEEGYCFYCGECISAKEWKQCRTRYEFADVLMAVRYLRPDFEVWAADREGEVFIGVPIPGSGRKQYQRWDLGLPFDEQYPECITFLHSLLCR